MSEPADAQQDPDSDSLSDLSDGEESVELAALPLTFSSLRGSEAESQIRGAGDVPGEFAKYRVFLEEGEKVLFAGPITKRRHLGMSVKQRELILTDHPRLIYIDPKTSVVKGRIPISEHLTCIKRSKRKFDVKVPGRLYDLEANPADVDIWIHHIVKSVYRARRNEQEPTD